MSIIFALFSGLIVFVLCLAVLTFSTAWLADVTGLFRLLFIARPTRLAFRVLRWLVAGAAAVAVVAAIE